MSWVLRNWLILAASLAVLSALSSYLAGAGFPAAAATLHFVGFAAAGLLAIVDGVRRLLGQPSLLGGEEAPSRVLAVVQLFLGLILLSSLLTAAN